MNARLGHKCPSRRANSAISTASENSRITLAPSRCSRTADEAVTGSGPSNSSASRCRRPTYATQSPLIVGHPWVSYGSALVAAPPRMRAAEPGFHRSARSIPPSVLLLSPPSWRALSACRNVELPTPALAAASSCCVRPSATLRAVMAWPSRSACSERDPRPVVFTATAIPPTSARVGRHPVGVAVLVPARASQNWPRDTAAAWIVRVSAGRAAGTLPPSVDGLPPRHRLDARTYCPRARRRHPGHHLTALHDRCVLTRRHAAPPMFLRIFGKPVMHERAVLLYSGIRECGHIRELDHQRPADSAPGPRPIHLIDRRIHEARQARDHPQSQVTCLCRPGRADRRLDE
jgi:hypothetical protein